jgi:ribose 5-phosphate isomerase B
LLKIAIGSDHAGWKLKEKIKAYLEELGHQLRDFGTDSSDSCDYPDFALAVAEAVAGGEEERGILICSTGIGMTITANKVPGIRAAFCKDEKTARLSREHNDANVLTLSSNMGALESIRNLLRIWLNTGFAGGRHARRVEKITRIEEKYSIAPRLG